MVRFHRSSVHPVQNHAVLSGTYLVLTLVAFVIQLIVV